MKTRRQINKRSVIQLIAHQIAADLAALVAAARATHEEATHEQNKPENKYDTRALEASYLARGQGRQIAELERARDDFEALSLVELASDAPIDLGALLTLETGNVETMYLLGPRAGGMEVTYEGTPITVITPSSPIGQQLLGKVKGDVIVLPNDRQKRNFKITRVL